eukprot:GSChrysophyteH1.ASY1.ANO1.940.1 assembled CDS
MKAKRDPRLLPYIEAKSKAKGAIKDWEHKFQKEHKRQPTVDEKATVQPLYVAYHEAAEALKQVEKMAAEGTLEQPATATDTATDTGTGTTAQAPDSHLSSLIVAKSNAKVAIKDQILVVSGSADKTVRVWDVSTGQCEATCIGLNNRPLVVSGSSDMTVRVWDVSTGQCEATWKGHSGAVWSVCFSPNGKRVVSGSDDK